MLIGVGVSCRISYSIISYLYVSCRGSITSVGEERAFYSYRLLVIMWFVLGGISSSAWCLGKSCVIISHEPCEVIVYTCSGVRPSVRRSTASVVHHFQISLLRSRLANQSQISCGASMGRGNKSLYNGSVHMTKMDARPIYGKNF